MMNSQEATKAIDNLTYGAYGTPEREVYNTERSRITGRFMKYLAFEHAHHLSKEIHEVLWPEAWSDGHDYGFAEIEGYYLAAVDFANRILKASEK